MFTYLKGIVILKFLVSPIAPEKVAAESVTPLLIKPAKRPWGSVNEVIGPCEPVVTIENGVSRTPMLFTR